MGSQESVNVQKMDGHCLIWQKKYIRISLLYRKGNVQIQID